MIAPCRGEPIINLSISFPDGNRTNGFALSWESSAGEKYDLLTTRALAPAAWQALNPVALTSSNRITFVDQNGDQSRRFYRVLKLATAVEPLTNMVRIAAGTFTMGSPETEAEREGDEAPQTEVTISREFWMGKYEVTQREYVAVMGNNPSFYLGELKPVDSVNWIEATDYCAKLTARERQAGRLPDGYSYRLPTEAEWEYACRAGTTTALHYGTELRSGMANFFGQVEYESSVGTISNPNGIDLLGTATVGAYESNAWGLYDMHGNIREWCRDRKGTYPGGSVVDPQGAASGQRVNRGGSWYSDGRYCRSADRYSHNAIERWNILGFRVVLARG